jgi:hypothetical protein
MVKRPKLILRLALVLSGGLSGCSETMHMSDTVDADLRPLPKAVQGEIWNKTLKTNWTDTKITLYRATGEVVQLKAKKAIYQVWTTNNWAGNHSSNDRAVVVFVDQQNGKVWLGNANTDKDTNFKVLDFYVENDSGIVSVSSILFGGAVQWHRSLIAKANPGEDVGAMISRLEKSINGWWLLEPREETSLSPCFRQWFFYPRVYASAIGVTDAEHIEVNDGEFRMDFTSPAYKTKGSVLLDTKTWKVIKTVEFR